MDLQNWRLSLRTGFCKFVEKLNVFYYAIFGSLLCMSIFCTGALMTIF